MSLQIFRGPMARAVIAGLFLGGATGQIGSMFGLSIIWPLVANVFLGIVVGHQIRSYRDRGGHKT